VICERELPTERRFCSTFGYLQWLPLERLLSTVAKRNSEDKTLSLHFTQPLQIAFIVGWV
jgi:hypothetical protein